MFFTVCCCSWASPVHFEARVESVERCLWVYLMCVHVMLLLWTSSRGLNNRVEPSRLHLWLNCFFTACCCSWASPVDFDARLWKITSSCFCLLWGCLICFHVMSSYSVLKFTRGCFVRQGQCFVHCMLLLLSVTRGSFNLVSKSTICDL